MINDYPKRKMIRVKNFDYSSEGAYFITICVQDRKQILSYIENPPITVGVGALDDPQIRLTSIGKIVEKNLLSSEKISGVRIDKYVIMPDHIHVIIFLNPSEFTDCANGSSRAPTPTNAKIPLIISAFKRFCSKEIGYNIFQRGYTDHIIRDQEDYETRFNYINTNPRRWINNKTYNPI